MAKDNYNKQALHRLLGAIVLLILALIIVPRFIRMPSYKTLANLDITYPGEDRTVEDQAIAAATTEQEAPKTTPTENASGGATVATRQAQDTSATKTPKTVVKSKAAEVASNHRGNTAATSSAPNKTKSHTGSVAQETQSSKAVAKETSPAQDEDQVLALIQGKHIVHNGFLIQIAAYSNEAVAVSKANRLKSHGISQAYVETVRIHGRRLYRLRVGPFKTQSAAQSVRNKLKKLGYPSSLSKIGS